MIILGLDTSTPATAVALRLADGTIQAYRHDPRDGESTQSDGQSAAVGRPGHATELLPLANRLLAEANLDWPQLTRIAVGVGPGTFTGLRVGVATARGLAQALDIELVPVSSLRALAHRAARDWPHAILAAIDARRGEVFAAGYAPAGELSELLAPRALAPEEIALLLSEGEGEGTGEGTSQGGINDDESHGGRKGESWLAVGDGAVRYRSQLERPRMQVPPDSSPLHHIDAAAICELALTAPPADPASVLPDYLRRPDAELALQGAQG
jgi:tRNA threonylcarbamoyladenosine biosynthesis protein TsaB